MVVAVECPPPPSASIWEKSLTVPDEPRFARLSSVEEQFAFPFEDRGRPPTVSRPVDSGSARKVLEDTLRDALTASTCYVAFSGGRDSSALLAVAVEVARREGLPLPVPVTGLYPRAPRSDEAEWQQLVLNHLGMSERIVVQIRDEQRLLGPTATAAIRRHGLVWPEAAQLQGALLAGLESGASFVSGEGGDNVITGGRAAPLRKLTHTWPPRRGVLRASGRAVLPRQPPIRLPSWYTDAGVEELRAALRQNDPLRWDIRTRTVLQSSAAQVLFTNVKASIAEFHLRPIVPFVEPSFLAALAREGGLFGFGSRSLTFDHLVGDLLPREIISRATKASFNETRWGKAEREFAESWSGAGIDPTRIDADKLRTEWLSESPAPQSDFLLHLAWVAQVAGGSAHLRRSQ